MNVLITGASGLVGKAICKRFLKSRIKVIGTYNNTPIDINDPNFSSLKIDLTREKHDTGIEYNCVIHCSAIIPNQNFQISDEELYELNQKIDHTVFTYCLDRKVKLIYISTAYLYSDGSSELLNEDSPTNGRLAGYFKSKKDSEDYLQKSNLTYTIFRISSPYGDLQKQTNVIRLFSDKIKNNLPVTFVGKGERRQNFIHVDDISEACLVAIENDKHKTYNLTYDRSYTMIELASVLKEIYNSNSEFVFDLDKTEVQINVNFDNSRIKTELDWMPKTDLRSGLLKAING